MGYFQNSHRSRRTLTATVPPDRAWNSVSGILFALAGGHLLPACDDYAARLSTLTNQKRGCPTSRAFREVGHRAADTGGWALSSHPLRARHHFRRIVPHLLYSYVE